MISAVLKIKALSVNEAWRGRRFKTKKYEEYEKELLYILPKGKVESGKLGIRIDFGFSSTGQDIDSGIKQFLDALQKKYDFNDNKIFEAYIKKSKVKKGEEYIYFNLYNLC